MAGERGHLDLNGNAADSTSCLLCADVIQMALLRSKTSPSLTNSTKFKDDDERSTHSRTSQSSKTPLPTQQAISSLRRTPFDAQSSDAPPSDSDTPPSQAPPTEAPPSVTPPAFITEEKSVQGRGGMVTSWGQSDMLVGPYEACLPRDDEENNDEEKVSDSDYDTDLELEVEEQRDDVTCRSLYMKTCRLYGVTPVDYFLRHFKEPRMEIKHRCLGPNGVKALAVPLQINTHIASLNLEGNMMRSEGVRHVAFMLGENHYITELNLAWNGLLSEGARLLCQSLVSNRNIRHVDVSGNGFKDKDAVHLATLMEENTTLRELNLSHNEFSESGAVLLGRAIGNNDTLHTLDLSWNHLRLRGAEAIARGLQENISLHTLNLSMNGFGSSGIGSVARALEGNSGLHRLDISNNRADTVGCQAVARALAVNSTLTHLEMGLNPFNLASVYGIIAAVESNEDSVLEYLDLTGALVQVAFMQAVERIQEKRRFQVEVSFVSQSRDHENHEPVYHCTDKNPLEILLVFMAEKRLRLIDLFKNLDKDQSGTLERDEFIEGLQSVETPLSEAQLDELIDMLDKDGDGEIDIGEIMNINKEFRDIKMKATRKVQEKQAAARVKMKAAMTAVQAANTLANNIEHARDDDTAEDDGPTEENGDVDAAVQT